MKKDTTINALKFDGKVHRSWKANLIEQKANSLLFVGKFEEEVSHKQLGVIRRSTLSYEYYWLDRWYNIFRFHEPDGALRNYYCNINLPPKFENGVLSYVDLDIDVLVWRDFSFEILDIDEFGENSQLFKYPISVIEKCYDTIKELEYLIKNRLFPFDFIEIEL